MAYGVIMLPLAIGWAMLVAHVPTYYGAEVGLGLGLAGAIIAIGRIFDIGTDFLVGWWSDHTRFKFRGRKTWIIVGLPVFCLAFSFLLMPPENAGPVYLVLVITGYFLSYTIVEIPHSAIGLELAQDAKTKTRLAASKSVFLVGGGLVGASLPALFAGDAELSYPKIVITVWCLAAVTLPVFLIGVPRAEPSAILKIAKLKNAFDFFRSQTALHRLLVAFALVQLGSAFLGVLSLPYATHILGEPDKVGLFWLATGIGFLCGMPVWIFAAQKISRWRVWSISLVGLTPVFVILFLFGVGDVNHMYGASFVIGFFGACDTIIFISILASIVKQEETKNGFSVGGTMSAARYFITKSTISVPLLLAFPLLSLIGFDTGGTSQATAVQMFVLTALYAGVPMVSRLLAFLLLMRSQHLLAVYN